MDDSINSRKLHLFSFLCRRSDIPTSYETFQGDAFSALIGAKPDRVFWASPWPNEAPSGSSGQKCRLLGRVKKRVSHPLFDSFRNLIIFGRRIASINSISQTNSSCLTAAGYFFIQFISLLPPEMKPHALLGLKSVTMPIHIVLMFLSQIKLLFFGRKTRPRLRQCSSPRAP